MARHRQSAKYRRGAKRRAAARKRRHQAHEENRPSA
jgi:hypothetical protein